MKWIEKLEFSIYDTMGIILPGAAIFYYFIFIFGLNINFDLKSLNTVVLLLVFYILGNSLKILSQFYYDLFKFIFNDFIFVLLKKLIKFAYLVFFKNFSKKIRKFKIYLKMKLKSISYLSSYARKSFFIKNRNKNYSLRKTTIKSFLNSFKKIIDRNFNFKCEKYDINNEFMIKEIISSLNEKSDTKLESNWYSIYKIGKVYSENNGVKTLSDMFLAKYTLYRSLSFIFFINFMCLLFQKNNFINKIISTLSNIENLSKYYIVYEVNNKNIWRMLFTHTSHVELYYFLLISSYVFWITFNIKYKKYYKLCGNEVLVGLYYKIKLNGGN